jgi:ubiquinone/menaquinone biosynthesis C-methylase UbiE
MRSMDNPLKKELQDLSAGNVLDAATGRGWLAGYMSDTFKDYDEIIGIDSSEKAIESARDRVKKENVRFEVMSAAKMSFEDDSFDIVAISNSLHHLGNIESVLDNMMRVLKPGGLYIILEPYQDEKTERPNSYRHAHHWWAEIDRALGVTHNETLTRNKILEFADSLGLKERREYDFTETLDKTKEKEILKFLIEKCDENINKITENPGLEELVEKGRQLKEIYSASGFTMDPELYIFGRK